MSFEKEYKERVVATCIVDIVKEMMSSDFSTGMTSKSYYRYT